MKIYAAGFNAWNQLELEREPNTAEPEDIYTFKEIIEGNAIEAPVSRLTYTIVRVDGRFVVAGHGLPDAAEDIGLVYTTAVNGIGEILRAEPSHNNDKEDQTESFGSSLVKYRSLEACKAHDPVQTWPCRQPVKQVAAFDVGFVILYADGSVATLGDPRYEDCLGREVDDANPADAPCGVSELNNLGEPVRKVAAGGYMVTALTTSGGLYVWGMGSVGDQNQSRAIPDICGIPNYVEVDGDADIEDVAVGTSHAIVLTGDARLLVIGDNRNGQLGLGMDDAACAQSWTRLHFSSPHLYHPVGVAAGPRSSFVIMSDQNRRESLPQEK
ncbi:unnamed protein product [Clonostachys rosea f. rosea IK726]|uniref:Uncharacterized protein n=2 Tax=Bionectria ochroleuca TaxID=29856 RepID=A0A0B7JZD0_BIOOC|nr:unnamed protein product [Clonostachys rosea f. rosea IK726]